MARTSIRLSLKYVIHPIVDGQVSSQSIRLAMPVIFGSLSMVFMNLADMAMVGRLGAKSLAAVGMGSMLALCVLGIGFSVRASTQSMVARRLGEQKFDECGVAFRNGLLIALFLGLPISLLGYFFSPYFVPFFIEDSDILSPCIAYTSILFLRNVFSYLGFAFQGFYNGIEKTKLHMSTMFTSNALNVYLNIGLIFGSHAVSTYIDQYPLLMPFKFLWTIIPFPELGIRGAAIATVTSTAWFLIQSAGYLILPTLRRTYSVFKFRFNFSMLRKQLELGVPLAIQNMMVFFGFAIFFKIIGKVGTYELAASEVVFNIMSFSFMPGSGIGQACATLVGKYLGEKKPTLAEAAIIENVRWSMLIMGSIGVLFITIPEYILPIFTNDPIVIRLGIIGLQVLGFVQFADAISMVLMSALHGAGNTKFPATVEAILSWLFFLPLTYLLGITFNFGFIGIWFSLGLYIMGLALVLSWKIYQGDWKEIKI